MSPTGPGGGASPVIIEPLSQASHLAGADALVGAGRGSLRRVLGEAPQRRRLLLQGLVRERVLLAHDGQRALGFAALKIDGQGPFSPPWSAFRREFGLWGALWRFSVFRLAERRDARHGVYLYGMHVDVHERRRGVASALLVAVDEAARARGAAAVHLEVGENNAAARALYERHGYVIEGRLGLGPAARWLPFGVLVRMRRDL